MGRKTQQVPVPMDTRWKQIPYFENYWVSNNGHIFNMRLQVLMEQFITNKGVRCVRIWRNGHRFTKSVAKLVRENFGENDDQR